MEGSRQRGREHSCMVAMPSGLVQVAKVLVIPCTLFLSILQAAMYSVFDSSLGFEVS